ncbi:MAG: hypothetical protein R3C59_29230 [Planctomycetaceae bacterium]
MVWSSAAVAADAFRITVVDQDTGRGIPMVEFRTVSNVAYVSDSAGVVAFHEPGLMDRRTFFHVSSHGYESPNGGFGSRGHAFDVTSGGQAVLKLKRINIAERLYRITGGGIYHDSVLLGDRVPLAAPVLNAGVLGSDSVENAVFNGRIHWFWGDTNLPQHPLGIFDVPGATSELPQNGGLQADVGVDLRYFEKSPGVARATADLPGSGPTWISGLTVLPDESGRERMFASYAKIKPPLETYERGMVEFDVATEQFRHVQTFPLSAPLYPTGHPVIATDNGQSYVYFPTPFPVVRVPATVTAFQDLSQYEAFTCLQPGSTIDNPIIDRDAVGVPRYEWKKGVPAVNREFQKRLERSGQLPAIDQPFRLIDVQSGRVVRCHGGSVYWNEYRRRWVTIMLELGGTSLLGEIWYAEADNLLGPWQYARKVVTHNDYSFYNPKQHPMLDEAGGRRIYFEGTYTHTFSGTKHQTPRYDYNQIMYRLDLTDERLALPVPVYRSDNALSTLNAADSDDQVPQRKQVDFYALDRKTVATIPVYSQNVDGHQRLTLAATDGQPVFFALPMNDSPLVAGTVPLLEYQNSATGIREYRTTPPSEPGFEEVRAVCRVWSAGVRP